MTLTVYKDAQGEWYDKKQVDSHVAELETKIVEADKRTKKFQAAVDATITLLRFARDGMVLDLTARQVLEDFLNKNCETNREVGGYKISYVQNPSRRC